MADPTLTTPLLVGGRPARTPQYITAFSATLGSFVMGTILVYSSSASPRLMDNTTDDFLHLTPGQNSWFSSLVNVGALVGGPVGGLCLNKLGRRGTMMASTFLATGGWLLIGFAQNFTMLLAGRVVTGLYIGITAVAVPIYIGEYASPDVRGALGSGFHMMMGIGAVCSFILGVAVSSWRWLALLCIIPVPLHFILMSFAKESPSYLLFRGKEEQAAAALQFFRGKDTDIQTELNMMRTSLEERLRSKPFCSDLRKPYILKPFLICLGLMVFEQWSDKCGIMFNLKTIFSEDDRSPLRATPVTQDSSASPQVVASPSESELACVVQTRDVSARVKRLHPLVLPDMQPLKTSGSKISDDLSSIIVGLVEIVGVFVVTILMDRAGRKLLLIVSSSIMALSLVALGEFFYLKSEDAAWTEKTLGWLPLLSIMLFIIGHSVGYGPIPWVMMGELFSPNVKELAACQAIMLNRICAFVVAYIYTPLQVSVGDAGMYWIFAGICVLGLVFSVAVVPETKGKTLEEITASFGGPALPSSPEGHDCSDC